MVEQKKIENNQSSEKSPSAPASASAESVAKSSATYPHDREWNRNIIKLAAAVNSKGRGLVDCAVLSADYPPLRKKNND